MIQSIKRYRVAGVRLCGGGREGEARRALCLEGEDRLQHAPELVRGVGQDDLGPEESHHLAPLNREGLRHDADEGVAARGADHRQAEARVSAGRLHHRLARLEKPVLLGELDHAQREPVLDRTHGVHEFGLDVDVDSRRRRALQFDQRSRANRGADGVVAKRRRGVF